MTYEVIALICMLGQDPAECQPPTAQSVFTLSRGIRNEIECQRRFEMDLAKVAALYDPAMSYPKLACERVEDERL